MQCEHLQPRGELHGQLHEGAPDPVLVEAVQRKVGQPGVFGVADAVLAAGAAAVPQLQVGELPAAGVGGERGQPQPVAVGEPQLGAGVRAFFAHDDPHARRPAGQVEQAGGLGDPRAVTDLPVGVVGGGPGRLGDQIQSCGGGHRSAKNPTEYDRRRAVR